MCNRFSEKGMNSVVKRGIHIIKTFINQARAGRRLVRAWFLKIDSVWIVSMQVCVRVCVCTRGY